MEKEFSRSPFYKSIEKWIIKEDKIYFFKKYRSD